jgi:hypothetical protein
MTLIGPGAQVCAGGKWQKGGACKRFSRWREGTPGRARLLSPRYTVVA